MFSRRMGLSLLQTSLLNSLPATVTWDLVEGRSTKEIHYMPHIAIYSYPRKSIGVITRQSTRIWAKELESDTSLDFNNLWGTRAVVYRLSQCGVFGLARSTRPYCCAWLWHSASKKHLLPLLALMISIFAMTAFSSNWRCDTAKGSVGYEGKYHHTHPS